MAFQAVQRKGSDDDEGALGVALGSPSSVGMLRPFSSLATVTLSDEELSHPGARRPSRYVFLLVGLAALNSANLGYDIGVMSGAALRAAAFAPVP